MATVGIPRASGYADYSSGGTSGFVPELWSTKLTTKFYNTTVFGEISNSDYEGEISRMGDVVHIRRTPDITVSPYQVGMTISYQVPDVQATELVIDQGLYWAYQIDNVDRYQSDIDLMDDFTQDAVQKTMEQQDSTLLSSIHGQVDAANQGAAAGAVSGDVNLGATGAALSVTSGNVIDSVLLSAGQILDEAKVPRDGKRWIVLPSWMIRKMKNSELKYAYETGDAVSPLRNGRVGRTDDFIIYQSNNLTPVTDGAIKGYNCPFGHPAGLTWASQFIDTDAVKLVNQIGTGVYSAGNGLTLSGTQFSLSTPVTLANGGSGATTAAGARANLGAAGLYATTIGDGTSLSFSVTHNLNNAYPTVALYLISSGEQIEADVVSASANAVTISSALAFPNNGVKVVVEG